MVLSVAITRQIFWGKLHVSKAASNTINKDVLIKANPR
jgi:hypothetical protein